MQVNQKYQLLKDETIEVFGKKLFRIQALVNIGSSVEVGDKGGFIEKEENLSADGDAWVYGDARVYGDAQVYGNAQVCGDARVCGNAQVYGNARVYGDAQVYGDARVCGDAQVCGEYSMLIVSNIGSVQRTTTFFVCADLKIRVSCGCFFGDLAAFRAKVRETHKDTKHAQTYLAAADFAESVLVLPEKTTQEDSEK